MPLSLKVKFYRTTVRPTLLYGVECWANKKHLQKMSVAMRRMLRWMHDKTRKNKVKNEDIRHQVEPIENKLRENCLQCFGHIRCRSRDAHIKRMKKIDIARGKKVERKTKNVMDESDKKLYEIIKN